MAYPFERHALGGSSSRDPVAQHANGTAQDRRDFQADRPVTVYTTKTAVVTVPHHRRLDSSPYNLLQAEPEYLNPRQGAARSTGLHRGPGRSAEYMHPRQRYSVESHRRTASAPNPRAFEAPKTYINVQDQHGQVDRRPSPPQDAGLGKGGWKRPVTYFPRPLNAITQQPIHFIDQWVDHPRLKRRVPLVDPGSILMRDLPAAPKAPSTTSISKRRKALKFIAGIGSKMLGRGKTTPDTAVTPKTDANVTPNVPADASSPQPACIPRPGSEAQLNLAWNNRHVRSRNPTSEYYPDLGGKAWERYEGKGKGRAYSIDTQALQSRQRYRVQYPPSARAPFHRRTASQTPSVKTIPETGESDAERDRYDSTLPTPKSRDDDDNDDDVPLAIIQANIQARALRRQRALAETIKVRPRQGSASTSGRTFVSLTPAGGTQLTRQRTGRFTLDSEMGSTGDRKEVQGVKRSNSRFTIDSEMGSVASQRLHRGVLRVTNPDDHDISSCICPYCRRTRMQRRFQTCKLSERIDNLQDQEEMLLEIPRLRRDFGTSGLQALKQEMEKASEFSDKASCWASIADEEEWFQGIVQRIMPLEVRYRKLVSEHCTSPSGSGSIHEGTSGVAESDEDGAEADRNDSAMVGELAAKESTTSLENDDSQVDSHTPPVESDDGGVDHNVPGAWVE